MTTLQPNLHPHPHKQEAPKPVRFGLEAYYKLADIGILDAKGRYELLDGVIYHMTPLGPKHATRLKKLEQRLEACVGEAAVVFTQHPLQIPDVSEPQPDILVVKPPIDQYEERHPTPADVLLVVELAVSTLATDRTSKLELYARAGIPEYWIVDLNRVRLEVYRNPDKDEGRYLESRALQEGEAVTSGAFEGCHLTWWQ